MERDFNLKLSVLAEPALVGRERELEELQLLLDSAVKGKGSTVLVSGEAGAGKTRLVTEFLKTAKKSDIIVLTGWCLSNAAVPYFPFFEAFNVYFSGGLEKADSENVELKSWLLGPAETERFGKSQVISPQVWKDQTFAAVASTLASIAAKKTVVLFIDDLHWADSASLALFHYIASAVESLKVLLLATYRSEQRTLDAEGRPHPLVETLRLMKREDLFEEIKVGSLSEGAVSALAKSMLGGDLQSALAEKLAGESQGNPLFVVESLRMLRERDVLVEEQDKWRLVSDELGIPDKIKDIILQRLAVLRREQRRMLDAASVIGEKFDAKLLSSILGLNQLEVIETLDSIAKDTCLVYNDGDLYRFDHIRSRDAIYDELSPALKKGYHAEVAENLEAMFKNGELPFSEIAYHFAQAGNIEEAIKYSMAAGQDALARWSNSEAIRHFNYVLKVVGERPEHREDRLNALEGLGDAFFANCMYKEATKVFEDLSNTVETGATKLRALRKALKSSMLFGDSIRSMELGKKAERYAAADRLENARILMDTTLALGRKIDRQLDDDTTALRVFEEEYSIADAASVLKMTGATKARLGMSQDGLADSLRSISLFEELGDFRSQMEAYFFAGLTLNNCLLLHEAFEMFGKVIELDEKTKMGDYFRLTDAYNFSALSLSAAGNFEKALTYSLKALELSKKTDSLIARGMVYSNLTSICVHLGDLKHAEEYFDKLMKLPPVTFNHIFVRAPIAQAVFFAGKNQWEKANQFFVQRFKELESSPAPIATVVGRETYAWALERQGRFAEAKVQLAEAQKIRQGVEAKFEHANLKPHVMVRQQVVVGEEFEMRLDMVNVGRKSGVLVMVEGLLPDSFEITSMPGWCHFQKGGVSFNSRKVDGFRVETVRIILRSDQAGTFALSPHGVYVDDLGETKPLEFNAVTIMVKSAAPSSHVVHGRISSGLDELDDLLLGGIAENYAVILSSSSSDEKELLVRRFLKAGLAAGETTFDVRAEAGDAKVMAEEFPSSFFLFLCNPRADAMIQGLPNVFRLKGVESLTEIDIALVKGFRAVEVKTCGSGRICLEMLSDVLLQHGAINTRKWLSALLPDLKSKGFTILAVIDPSMHPSEDVQAITGLFDGEIRVTEKETPEGIKQMLRVRKLLNQKYLEKEIVLSKERLP